MFQPAPSNEKLYDQVRHELDELARLRDEIRLKIHLAGMDARSTWAGLEKQLEQLEGRFGKEGGHAVEAARGVTLALREAYQELRNTLV